MRLSIKQPATLVLAVMLVTIIATGTVRAQDRENPAATGSGENELEPTPAPSAAEALLVAITDSCCAESSAALTDSDEELADGNPWQFILLGGAVLATLLIVIISLRDNDAI